MLVPRVRDGRRKREVRLKSYERLQEPRGADEGVLRRILSGLSCRKYEECAEAVPEAFGLSGSTISRRYIRASARALKEFCERRLEEYDFVALILDGKAFGADEMIVALGITVKGEKILLGFIQAGTENERVGREMLEGLLDRGLKMEEGLLCVIDGSKGLRKAVYEVFGNKVLVQRCQWHKRENVVSYLPAGTRGDTELLKETSNDVCPGRLRAASLLSCLKDLGMNLGSFPMEPYQTPFLPVQNGHLQSRSIRSLTLP
jgi:putative transposase